MAEDVILMVPVRGVAPELAVAVTFIVPEAVPLVPEVMLSQLAPSDCTAVDQDALTVPVFVTVKDVLPPDPLTLWVSGDTVRVELLPDV